MTPPPALSGVRVVGACSAKGLAAAHVLDMAGEHSRQQRNHKSFGAIDLDSLISVHETDLERPSHLDSGGHYQL